MPTQILIIHAPDANMEAKFISDKLILAGFNALTFEDCTGHASHQEIDSARFELIDESPVVLVLASPLMFKTDQLVEIALSAKDQFKLIPILYQYNADLPSWFRNPIDLSPDMGGSRGWNRLMEKIVRILGNLFWQFPLKAKPRIN